jgi:phage shock protein C
MHPIAFSPILFLVEMRKRAVRRFSMNKKFYRSRTDRKLWGVCGGIAQYFSIDPTLVRIIAVASLFVGSLGFWIYIITALIAPIEP